MSRWLVIPALAISLVVGACGGSSGASLAAGSGAPTAPPSAGLMATPAAIPSAAPTGAAPASAVPATGAPSGITPTAAPPSCPTAATVNAALGSSVAAPVGVTGGSKTKLPAGATGETCEYMGTGQNVIIEVITNVGPSAISLFSSKFPVAAASVSGVGDQARAFSQSLGAGKTNEGVVAVKGTTLVAITATDTPATLARLEALVKQLL